jgi:hypothetical protein
VPPGPVPPSHPIDPPADQCPKAESEAERTAAVRDLQEVLAGVLEETCDGTEASQAAARELEGVLADVLEEGWDEVAARATAAAAALLMGAQTPQVEEVEGSDWTPTQVDGTADDLEPVVVVEEELFTDGARGHGTAAPGPQTRTWMRKMSVPIDESKKGWWSHLRVNTVVAEMYAATEHARSRHFGALSHAQFVMVMLKRVQAGYITIFSRESSTALALGYGLRVVSGYQRKDKKAALPECLAHEDAPVHWGMGSGVESRV